MNTDFRFTRFQKDLPGTPKGRFLFFLWIALVAVLAYSPSMSGDFLLDDVKNILENQYVQIDSFSLENLFNAAFKSPIPTRPLPNITFALNHLFHGLHPFGYHLVNLILHLLTGWVVFRFLFFTIKLALPWMKENRNAGISLLTTAVFLLHPVQTQSVSYIVQRMNIMAALFFVLCLYFYALGRTGFGGKQKVIRFGMCALSAVFAFSSKENTAVLPVFLFMYEWFFFPHKKGWAVKTGLLAMVLLAIIIPTVIFLFNLSPVKWIASQYDTSFSLTMLRVLTEFRVLVYYFSLLVFPHPSRLLMDYLYPPSYSIIHPATTLLCIISIFALVLLGGILFQKGRSEKLISFCIFWFFGSIFIESSVINLDLIFEHRLYLPGIGFFLFAVYMGYLLLHHLSAKKGKAILSFSFILLVLFSQWTWQRNHLWADAVAMWKDCLDKATKPARAHYNLAVSLGHAGKFREVESHYRKAIALNPYMTSALYNLGTFLAAKNQNEEAISLFKRALITDPDNVKVMNNLGATLIQAGKASEAQLFFQKAISADPQNANARANLALLLMEEGKTEEAIAQYEVFTRLRPDDPMAHLQLAGALKKKGEISPAIRHLYEVLRMIPESATIHYHLAELLFQEKKFDDGKMHIKKALEIHPEYGNAYYLLARMYSETGEKDNAEKAYLAAIEKQPDHAFAHYNLGILFLQDNKTEKAIHHFETGINLIPKNLQIHINLAGAYDQAGRYEEAIFHYQQALYIRPESVEAENNLAVDLAILGYPDAANRHFQNALMHNPDSAKTRDNYAIFLNNHGIPAEKKEKNHVDSCFHSTLEKRLEKAEQYYTLAKLQEQRGDKNKAFILLKKTLAYNPDHLLALNRMALLDAEEGRTNAAIFRFEQILSINPKLSDIYYNIACLYGRKNQKTKALDWLEKALEKGFSETQRIKTDPDLACIRDTQLFRKTVQN